MNEEVGQSHEYLDKLNVRATFSDHVGPEQPNENGDGGYVGGFDLVYRLERYDFEYDIRFNREPSTSDSSRVHVSVVQLPNKSRVIAERYVSTMTPLVDSELEFPLEEAESLLDDMLMCAQSKTYENVRVPQYQMYQAGNYTINSDRYNIVVI